jgi:hypothetical protein
LASKGCRFGFKRNTTSRRSVRRQGRRRERCSKIESFNLSPINQIQSLKKSLNFVTNDEAATLAIDYQSLKFQL